MPEPCLLYGRAGCWWRSLGLSRGAWVRFRGLLAAVLRARALQVLDALLEPKVNTFVVVIDGMLPENVNATQTPNICNLIDCLCPYGLSCYNDAYIGDAGWGYCF